MGLFRRPILILACACTAWVWAWVWVGGFPAVPPPGATTTNQHQQYRPPKRIISLKILPPQMNHGFCLPQLRESQLIRMLSSIKFKYQTFALPWITFFGLTVRTHTGKPRFSVLASFRDTGKASYHKTLCQAQSWSRLRFTIL